MARSILIGLDGSPYSSNAVELAIRWGKQHGAFLVGLGIVDEPGIREATAVPVGGAYFKSHADQARLDQARHKVEQFLEQFALRCSEAQIAHKVLEDTGVPYERILLEAQRYDLILLGQQTYFHFATQDDACETLKSVLKSSPRPVITVPEKRHEGQSVVIAYDGSLQAARALQGLEASGLCGNDPVYVVTIGEDHLEAARIAERAIDFLTFHEIRAEQRIISPGHGIAETMLEQAEKLQARLLVMGAYGHSSLREFFLGSITRTMLKQSPVPLFLYH